MVRPRHRSERLDLREEDEPVAVQALVDDERPDVDGQLPMPQSELRGHPSSALEALALTGLQLHCGPGLEHAGAARCLLVPQDPDVLGAGEIGEVGDLVLEGDGVAAPRRATSKVDSSRKAAARLSGCSGSETAVTSSGRGESDGS